MAKKKLKTVVLEGINERFLEAKDEILGNKKLYKVPTKYAFTDSIDMVQGNLNEIAKGVRSVTVHQAALLCKNYGYNGNWILNGIGPKKLREIDSYTPKLYSQTLKDISKALADRGL